MKQPSPGSLTRFLSRAGLVLVVALLAFLVARVAFRRATPSKPPSAAAVSTAPGEEITEAEPPENHAEPPHSQNTGGLAAAIAAAQKGATLAFALPDGATVSGTVNTLAQRPDGTRYAGGRLAGYRRASFFLSVRDGVPGGHVLVYDTGRAYVLEPADNIAATAGGDVVWQEKPLGDVICYPFPPAPDAPAVSQPDATATADTSAAAVRATPVPAHESRPGAPVVFFLDFEGGVIEGTVWNDDGPIIALASAISDANITAIWRRVAEDYAPFNINVTTDRVAYQRAAYNRRMRCIFTPTTDAAPGSGGVAYVGVLGNDSDIYPCWVFNSGLDGAAEAASHELGHTIGLYHDGQSTSSSDYYSGHGASPMRWGPIMGAAYGRDIVQWSKNEYAYGVNKSNGSTRPGIQDDVALIAAKISLGFANDSIGATPAAAASLAAASGSLQPQTGVITTSSDSNYHRLVLPEARSVTLRAEPLVTAANVPDLNIALTLLDAAGATLLVTGTGDNVVSNSALATLSATTGAVSLASGTYYVRIAGCGFKDPSTNGFSAYASIGRYILSGSLSAPFGAGGPGITAQPADAALAYSSTLALSVTATGAAPLSYLWHKDNAPLANATRSDGVVIAGATGATLTLTAPVPTDSGAYHVTVTDATGRAVASSPAAVTIAPPSPPVIIAQPESLFVTSTSAPPTTLAFSVTATGAAPLFYQWLRDGLPVNDSGRFTGATAASLSIASVTTADAASAWSVRVFNHGGAVVSDEARVIADAVTGNHWLAGNADNADWHDPENWSARAVPVATDSVYLNTAVPARIAPAAAAVGGTLRMGAADGESGALTLAPGATLAVAALRNGISGSGALVIEAGAAATIAGPYAQTPASSLALAPSAIVPPTALTATLAGRLVITGYAPSGTLIHATAPGGITGSFATDNLSATGYVSGTVWIAGQNLVYTQTLAWNRADVLAHGTFDLSAAGETFTLDEPLSDNTAETNPAWDGKTLAKRGPGTLTLAAGAACTGSTGIETGVLAFAGTLGSGAAGVAIAPGATLRLAPAADAAYRLAGALATSGTLDFASPPAGPYRALTVAGLASTGTTSVIRLRFDPASGAGDRLIVQGNASGAHRLDFAFDSEPPAGGPPAAPVITVTGANTATFTGTLAIGGIPYGVQLCPDGSIIFVRNQLSFTWKNTGAGDWENPANWDLAPLSLAANDSAGIRNGGTAVLSGSSSSSARSVYLGDDGSASPGAILVKDDARLSLGTGTIGYLGVGYYNCGSLTLAGRAAVDAGYITYIGYGTSASGTGTGLITVSDHALLETGTYLYVGNYGTGTLALGGNAVLRNSSLVNIANYAGSSGLVTVGDHARLETGTTNFYIGNYGAGTLALTGSATVLTGPATGTSSYPAMIGFHDGATGVATLDDDSVWDVHTSLRVGGTGAADTAGAGALEIAARARVAVMLSYNQTARGTLVIDTTPDAGPARAGPFITAKSASLGGALAVEGPAVSGTILHTTGGTISGSFASVGFTGSSSGADYLAPAIALANGDTDLVLTQTLAWTLSGSAAHGTFTLGPGETYTVPVPLAGNTAATNPAWDGKTLTKLGPGALTLADGNTYAGATRVTGGALIATGTLGGPVDIAAGASLALAGGSFARFTGALENNGTLDFATTADGPYRALTVSTLSGDGVARMSRNPATGEGDRLIVLGGATGALALDLALAGAPSPGDPPPHMNALHDLVTVAVASAVTLTGTATHGDRVYFLRQNSSGKIEIEGGAVEVTLDPAGGTVSPASKIVVPGAAYGPLSEPSRGGFAFAGWFTAATGGVEVTASSAVSPAADHTLYARWGELPPSLAVTPASRNVGAGGGSATFTVQNTGGGSLAYTAAVTAGDGWAAITGGATGTLGSGGTATVTLAHSMNPAGTAARAATLAFTAAGATGSPQTATLTQAANTDAPVLAVDQTILALAQPVNSSATFAVTGNIAWNAGVAPIGAGGDAGWLDVSPRTGAAGAQVTGTALALAANTTGAPRTAAITIAGAGLERAIIVTQRAAGAGAAAPSALATAAVLSFDLGTGGSSEIYNVAAGSKLAPAAGGAPLSYAYAATGDTATLIFDDALWMLDFAARRYRLYATDERTGQPYELEGAFAYTVIATFNTGIGGDNVTYEGKIVSPGRPYDGLPSPERTGYTLDGWFTAASGGSKITVATIVPVNAGPHTLYARWTAAAAGSSGGGGGAPSHWLVLALTALGLLRLHRKNKTA